MTIQAVSADGVVHEFPDETDTGVIGKAMRDYAASNLSASDDLKGGLHDLGTSVSQGLGAVGASGASDWVKSHTPDAPSGPAPSEQLAGALQHGDWGNIPGLIGHSLLRAGPSAAPIIAAGAIPGVGPLAAGAAAGALAIGPESYGRAANNGRSEPTTGDVIGAIPGALGEAVGGALLPGGSKLASPLGRAAVRVGKEAAGGAIMDASGQLGASVGTDKGASLDPYQTAGAALTQGALGAARSVPDVAASGIKAASDRAVASTLEAPATREDAESVIRVGNLMDDVRNSAINNNGKAQPDTVIANSVKSDLVTKLNRQVRQLRDAGLIETTDANDLRQLVNNQALRSNNTISEGLPGLASLYDRVDDLNLPDPVIAQIKSDVRDLNTVSSQSFIKNTTGPFQAAGKFLGKWGGTAAELARGDLPGAALATLMGHPAGKIGGAIGAGLDQMMGTNTPPIVLQRLNAARALRNMGFDPDNVPATADTVSANANAATARAGQQQAQDTFNATAATDQASLAAQAEQTAKIKQAQMDAAYKQHQQFQAQTDKAYDQNQPNAGPSIDDYLSGKVNDPSLLPPSKMTTPQELAIQAQRLRNAQLLAKQIASQQGVLDKAASSAPDARGQLALDKLTRNNAATLAAAEQTPTARPDIVPEAAAAAQGMMQKRAKRILGNADDGVTVGNPPDPIPVNTPIGGSRSPAQRVQAAQAILAPPEAQGAPTPPASLPMTAPAGHPQAPLWERLTANGNPGLSRQQVRDAAMAVHGPDALAVLDAHGGSVNIPGTIAPIQARLGQGAAQAATPTDRPVINSPTRYQAAVDKYHLHVANDVARLQQEGQTTAAHALLDIAVNHHSKAAKQAARAALPPAVASLIPDYVVNQGGA